MTEDRAKQTFSPADYPQLNALVEDPTGTLSPKEAFEIYERNWRFIDRDKLTDGETRLIRDLTDRFGDGEVYV